MSDLEPRANASLSVVIPAYDAEATLPVVLAGVLVGIDAAHVIVVDAGSNDRTAAIAEDAGVRVIRLPQREGPARARNAGADAADSELLLFLDSDCVPAPDVVSRVRSAFASDPELVSISGSYDDEPAAPGFFSRYMNLRHHVMHRAARADGAGFWAGCGAVRRSEFLASGGFDADRYPRPQIEDIELGLRLDARGRTARDPQLQVKHLKRWTLRSVVETDVLARALPWSRLILERGQIPNDLNVSRMQRAAAVLAPLVLLGPAALAWALWRGESALALTALAAPLASLALHRALLRVFSRHGLLFALGGWAFHQVHLCYSAATFAYCWAKAGRGAAAPDGPKAC